MKKTILFISAVLSLAVMSCNSTRKPGAGIPAVQDAAVYAKEDGATRIVSYNVGVFGKYTDNSSKMVSDMMKEIKADVMVLNEIDRNNERHSYDQLAEFAGYMGWKYIYAPAMPYKGGEYGNGLVYSGAERLLDSFTIPLKKKSGSEDRVCVVAEFVDFVLAGTHLDVGSEEDRINGARTITKELRARYANAGKPVFLCGDMNARPESEVIRTLEEDWIRISSLGNSHSSADPNKCIDYIFALDGTGGYKVTSSGVLTEFKTGDVKEASDHLPIYADVKFN